MANIATVASPTPLLITATQFFSFATPAITVPFPSAYAQTQIPFAYPATPTFAATRIPTTIGGVAATSGISSALKASGTTFGQSGTNQSSQSSWPMWATIVIAVCGGVALVVLGLGVFCWCTRHKRADRREAERARKRKSGAGNGSGKRRKGSAGFTEKHDGGGRNGGAASSAARAQAAKQNHSRGTIGGGTGKLQRPSSVAGDPNFYGVKHSSSKRSSRPARGAGVPYPPQPVPTRSSYPAPPMDQYGRVLDPAHATYPLVHADGYATPDDGFDAEPSWVPADDAGGLNRAQRQSYHSSNTGDMARTAPLKLSRNEHRQDDHLLPYPTDEHNRRNSYASPTSTNDEDWAPPGAAPRARSHDPHGMPGLNRQPSWQNGYYEDGQAPPSQQQQYHQSQFTQQQSPQDPRYLDFAGGR